MLHTVSGSIDVLPKFQRLTVRAAYEPLTRNHQVISPTSAEDNQLDPVSDQPASATSTLKNTSLYRPLQRRKHNPSQLAYGSETEEAAPTKSIGLNHSSSSASLKLGLTDTGLVPAPQTTCVSPNSVAGNPMKYLKNILNYPKLDTTIDKKTVLSHHTRPSTPHKRDESQAHLDFENELRKLEQQQQKQKAITDLENSLEEALKKAKQFELKLTQKSQQFQQLKKQLEAAKKSRSEKQVENLTLRAELQRVNPNAHVSQIRKLQDQNMALRLEIIQLNAALSKQSSQNAVLAKTLRSLNETIEEMERNRLRQAQSLASRLVSQQVAGLQLTVRDLKTQLADKSPVFAFKDQDIQETFSKLVKDLQYYRIWTHCLQKQMEDLRLQNSSKVSPKQYKELKSQLRILGAKYRQTLTKLRLRNTSRSNVHLRSKRNQDLNDSNDEDEEEERRSCYFQLTPEKQN